MSYPASPVSYRSTASSTRPYSKRVLHQTSVPHKLTQDEVAAMMENFSKEDTARQKTWTRLVVENFLSKYSWYFPRKNARNGPSLSKAYAYYEHITLPRRFVGEQNADHVLRRAEPGETEATELYDPFRTPPSSFIEWGVGVDLYFSSLRMLSIMMLIAGLINLPNILFYSGTDYSPDGKAGIGVFSLVSTAICTSGEWVVCENCNRADFANEEVERFRVAVDGTTLVLRNACNGGQLTQGMVNWATGFFLAGVIGLISLYLRAREVRFDEDKVTASDYSVVVRNPPPDAYDPDEWQAFFSQFADKTVTFVSVALDNHVLLEKLIARRYHMRSLRLILPKGTDLEDENIVRSAVAQLAQEQAAEKQGCLSKFLECSIFPLLRMIGMFLTPDQLVEQIVQLKNEIKELQKEKYNVCSVFVTFETEEGQRAALSALTASKFDVLTNNTANMAPSAVFRDKVLKVEDPTEPNSVRWLDLGIAKSTKIIARLVNLVVTIGMVALSGLAVVRVRANLGPAYAGPLISIFNSLIPFIVKLLMLFERHISEGTFQTSLYLKITLFRWVNTAILIKIITPFTSTVAPGSQDVLVQINAILWSELVLTPTLRLLDLWGNIQKHFFAPRARTQEIMDLNFQGTFYNLGERYTDLTKVLFVCFFYAALFPGTFFFGFAILVAQYYSDKYCLMRIWSWRPNIGPELARFSRRYFFSGSLVAYFLVSAYAWAQFPYDNICDPVNATTGVSGLYEYQFPNGTVEQMRIFQDTEVVFCQQSWIEYDGFPFPPTPRLQPEGLRWMTDSQETLTTIYGWTSVAVVVVFIVAFFGIAISRFLISWFRGVHEPEGQNQNIDYSSNVEIDAYVPMIKKGGFQFPFLACDIDNVDRELIGWTDPSHSYDYHNLIFDIPWEGMPRMKKVEGNLSEAYTEQAKGLTIADGKKRSTPLFSVVKHYPPDWKSKLPPDESAT